METKTEETLCVLIPVKVTPTMNREITTIAGGVRKRADYLRSLYEKDRERATAETKSGQIAARVAAAVAKDPSIEPRINSVLCKATRSRLVA